MVDVWLFAGGGESEVIGLVLFLRTLFTNCEFERKTPVRQKPGPKFKKDKQKASHGGYGKTGTSLVRQLKRQLRAALKHQKKCDLILVIDDLDCGNAEIREQSFLQAIDTVPNTTDIKKYICFAAPELETWIIADWDNTMAKEFRGCHEKIRRRLKEKGILFDTLESFSEYDHKKGSCKDKLSDMIISVVLHECEEEYKKSTHTPRMLRNVKAETVSEKCPLFKKFYLYLADFSGGVG